MAGDIVVRSVRSFPFSGTVDATGVIIGMTGDGSATRTIPGTTDDMIPIQWEIRNAGDTNTLNVKPGADLTFTAEAAPVLADYDTLGPGVGYSDPKRHPVQEINPESQNPGITERLRLSIQAAANTTTYSGWVHCWVPNV